MNFYDFKATKMNGQEICMEQYKGQVVLIVNTASKCGFTPQLKGLEDLYQKYEDKGFVILGFPCNQFANQDPAANQEISEFCSINYGVTFPMFQKIEVNGKDELPLYHYLKEQAHGTFGNDIKWNFTKFLINREGTVVGRFAPMKKPESLEKEIQKYL